MNIQRNYNNTPVFGAHLPKNFASMMNYIAKNAGYPETAKVSVILDSGLEVSGMVHFVDGKYATLIMDEGCEKYRQLLQQTALKNYNKRIASPKVRSKLGYDA